MFALILSLEFALHKNGHKTFEFFVGLNSKLVFGISGLNGMIYYCNK